MIYLCHLSCYVLHQIFFRQLGLLFPGVVHLNSTFQILRRCRCLTSNPLLLPVLFYRISLENLFDQRKENKVSIMKDICLFYQLSSLWKLYWFDFAVIQLCPICHIVVRPLNVMSFCVIFTNGPAQASSVSSRASPLIVIGASIEVLTHMILVSEVLMLSPVWIASWFRWLDSLLESRALTRPDLLNEKEVHWMLLRLSDVIRTIQSMVIRSLKERTQPYCMPDSTGNHLKRKLSMMILHSKW